MRELGLREVYQLYKVTGLLSSTAGTKTQVSQIPDGPAFLALYYTTTYESGLKTAEKPQEIFFKYCKIFLHI